MKYYLYQSMCDLAGSTERGLTKLGLWLIRPVQVIREWSWRKAALANLSSCNTRQVRETF